MHLMSRNTVWANLSQKWRLIVPCKILRNAFIREVLEPGSSESYHLGQIFDIIIMFPWRTGSRCYQYNSIIINRLKDCCLRINLAWMLNFIVGSSHGGSINWLSCVSCTGSLNNSGNSSFQCPRGPTLPGGSVGDPISAASGKWMWGDMSYDMRGWVRKKYRNTAKPVSGSSPGTNICPADHRIIRRQVRIYRAQSVVLQEKKWVCKDRKLLVLILKTLPVLFAMTGKLLSACIFY